MNIATTRIMKPALVVAGLSFLLRAGFPCTLAVISGKASANGRPLMWKNRDTSDPNNKLVHFTGPKYNSIAVVISEDVKLTEVWGGQNTEGFAIMNSQADDLVAKDKKFDGAGNGAFMELALGECATVGDFENLLLREKEKWDLAANFGVIDADGGACFFETRSDSYQKFDTKDPRVAPFGTIVRTNFAFTSPDQMLGGGFDRFERISHIIEAARAAGRIDGKFILQEAARAQAHPATMWVILGQPVAGVAVPVWPAAGKVPAVTTGPKTAPFAGTVPSPQMSLASTAAQSMFLKKASM